MREGADEGPQAAVHHHPVRRRRHRVLSHPVVKVARPVVAALHNAAVVDVGLGRAGQVGGAAYHFGDVTSKGVQNLVGSVAGGDFLALFEARQVAGKTFREFEGLGALEFRRQLRERFFVTLVKLVPRALSLFAALDDALKVLRHVVRHGKGGPVYAEVFLSLFRALVAERRAVDFRGVLVGRAVADDGPHRDDTWPVSDGLRVLHSLFYGLDVVAHLDPVGVPAVSLVALQHVFAKRHLGGSV